MVCRRANKVTDKLYFMLEKHKDVFFTIHLFSPEREASQSGIHCWSYGLVRQWTNGRTWYIPFPVEEEHWSSVLCDEQNGAQRTFAILYIIKTKTRTCLKYNCNECETHMSNITAQIVKYVFFFFSVFAFFTRRNWFLGLRSLWTFAFKKIGQDIRWNK